MADLAFVLVTAAALAGVHHRRTRAGAAATANLIGSVVAAGLLVFLVTALLLPERS